MGEKRNTKAAAPAETKEAQKRKERKFRKKSECVECVCLKGIYYFLQFRTFGLRFLPQVRVRRAMCGILKLRYPLQMFAYTHRKRTN